MLCKYKHIFGEEKKGFHQQRLLGFALYDVLGTVGIAVLLKLFLFPATSFILVFFWLMIVTIVVHRLFCVNTTLNKAIFGVVETGETGETAQTL